MKKILSTAATASVLALISAGSLQATPWGTEWTSQTINRSVNGTTSAVNTVDRSVKRVEDEVEDVEQEVKDLQVVVDNKIDELANRLIEALRLQTGETSSYMDKQIEADKRFLDATQQNETQRLRDQFRAEAESGKFDPPKDVCLVAGLYAKGDSNGTTGGRGSEARADVMAQMTGADPAVQQGGTALARSVVDGIEPYDGRSDGTVDVSIMLEDPTIDMSDEQTRRVVTRLMRNMIDPTPPRPVTAEELLTPEGVARAAEQQGRQSRLSAATELQGMTLNMRDGVVSSEGFRPLAADSAYNRDIPDVISELQAIDIRTVAHYAMLPEAAAEDRTVNSYLHRILDVMSINTRIAYLSLELQNRQAIAQAAQLGALLDN
ncbi:hypothetical protein [Palleronia sp.]|uniref:hypothetical protein n=1 Tax=Palleronia sp. TaxID=1940284 RepID=UPI0035C84CFC